MADICILFTFSYNSWNIPWLQYNPCLWSHLRAVLSSHTYQSSTSSLRSIVGIYTWMIHMSTGLPFNFTINSLSPLYRIFSTQLAVLLSSIIATPRWFSSHKWNILKPSLLQSSSSPGHLVPLIPRTFILFLIAFSHFPFCSKVLTFQHATFRWNFFLLTLVCKILWMMIENDFTPFPARLR